MGALRFCDKLYMKRSAKAYMFVIARNYQETRLGSKLQEWPIFKILFWCDEEMSRAICERLPLG